MQTRLDPSLTAGLGDIHILHPPGTFALTPASLIGIQAIGANQHLLHGAGLDWGSGTGCLAITVAHIAAVERVWGLEISEADVAIAGENARLNRVAHKVSFIHADSYTPVHQADRQALRDLAGRVDFILANPPSSDGDDGFAYRRLVLQGARPFLAPGGIVLLNISSQYGRQRIDSLCQDAPGFTHGGILASTGWVPFDLSRPDLLHVLRCYVQEERRGGPIYTFQHPDGSSESMNAQSALAHFEATGQSPLTKWQVHLFHMP